MPNVLLAVLAVATWYAAPEQYNGDVYCVSLTPAELIANRAPWVALDVKLYLSGQVECGDLIKVDFGDRWLIAYALDAGPMSKFYIADYPGLPILVDVPRHLWPLRTMSAVVSVVNYTRLLEALETEGLTE